MNAQAAQSGLALGLFVIVAALMILPLEPPGSVEYVVTLLALGIGVVTTGVIALAIRKFSR